MILAHEGTSTPRAKSKKGMTHKRPRFETPPPRRTRRGGSTSLSRRRRKRGRFRTGFKIYLAVLVVLSLFVIPLPIPGRGVHIDHVVAMRSNVPGYDRMLFSDGWGMQPDGCNTRDYVMAVSYDQPSCTTRYSAWSTTPGGKDVIDDPYTGKPLAPGDVEVDHLYPVSAAWDMGASTWPEEKRLAFYNDPDNLVAVSSEVNQDKKDKLPAEWMPPKRSSRCAYSRQLAAVANKYELPLSRADKAVMNRSCSGLRNLRSPDTVPNLPSGSKDLLRIN